MSERAFIKFSWGLVIYTLLVIIGGAFVRLTFSGDGCGNHWPLCDGKAIPPLGLQDLKTTIEFSHRIMSALYGLWVLALCFFGFKLFADKRIRAACSFTLLFTIFEALIGRHLVKRGIVGMNDSIERAIWLAVHLANTFLLIGSVVLVVAWAGGLPKPRLKGQGAIGWAIALGLISVVLVGVSGAVTSLGDQLFPVTSTPKAIQDAMDSTRHFLIQLRVFHPLIAISVGVYIVLLAGLVSHLRPSEKGLKFARWVVGLYGFQLAVGLMNVFLKAPDAMALFHLLVADIIWIVMVLWVANSLAETVPIVEARTPGTPDPGKAGWRDYVLLTKPRVISLLLFTTITALFASAGGWPGFGLLMVVLVGGYMSAGAANAINMVIDRDIDGTMKRTASRPTVTQKIPSPNALVFAFSLAVGSFLLLWLGANLLAAMLSLAGLAFYVVIYTLLLKRRTWQNIVIGGAAGAFPPLVGWAAFDGQLSPLAWLLFAIIFVWTPVHFWALALMIKDDYKNASVPMLPVVRGDRYTVTQIAVYAVVTVVVTMLPIFIASGQGPGVQTLYGVSAAILNVILLIRCIQLYRQIDRPRALGLYKFSMLYLALLFLIFAIDCSIPKSNAPAAAVSAGSLSDSRVQGVGSVGLSLARRESI